MSPIEFFQDLTNPLLTFLPKALLVTIVCALISGYIGTFVVLRGMAFVGDAVAHSVFPGIAVAFVLQGSLVLGGALAGFITALLVATFSQNKRLKEDSVIGVFFSGAFALGIVIVSQTPGYTGSLHNFLFGSITGISDSDITVVMVTAVTVLLVGMLFHKELIAVSLDRETARAARLPLFWFDLLLYLLVTAVVVIAVQSIGNILVLSLLITPAATARLYSEKIHTMMLVAPLLGAISATLGIYISWSFDLPAGGSIVLIATAIFLLSWIGAPRHGIMQIRRAA